MKAISCYQQPAAFTSLSQGPAAWEQLLQLNLSATGYWMEWPELPKIKMLKKRAIRNGFCLLTADGFKGYWGPLCFRSILAVTRLQQGFGKLCVLDGMDLQYPQNISDSQLNYKIWHDSECSEEIKEQEKTLRCYQSSDFKKKKKIQEVFPALFLEGCSWGWGAGWVLLSKAICSATPFLPADVKE